MKLSLVFSLAVAAAIRLTCALAQTTESEVPDFTCAVVQYPDNGCDDSDIPLMEQVMAKLFVAEMPGMKAVHFNDYVGRKEDVITLETSSKTYSLTGTRDLSTSICSIPGYCTSNPTACLIAGCPSKRRRRTLRSSAERNLATMDMGVLSIRGTMKIRNIPTTNPNCRPKELCFRCDLV